MSTKRLHPENPLIVETEYEGRKTYYYWCEGCQGHDCFTDAWTIVSWNPLTISPSVRLSQGEKTVCHVFIKNGIIEYLNDCAHGLRGQKVPMSPPKVGYFQGLES